MRVNGSVVACNYSLLLASEGNNMRYRAERLRFVYELASSESGNPANKSNG